MKVRIEFEIDNAAFKEDFLYEVEEILSQSKEIIITKCFQKKLIDTNGNSVGKVSLVKGGIKW